MFPGLYFNASQNYNDTNIGSLELSPRGYYVFLNQTSNSGSGYAAYGSFVVKNVKAGDYIWIEARSNYDSEGVKFTVTSTSGDAVRRDRAYQSDTDPLEPNNERHMFCYRADYDGNYTVTPSRACYLYFVAVLDHPLPVISFSTNEATLTITNRKADKGKQTYQNPATCYLGATDVTNANDLIALLQFSSDDESVVTVDNNTGYITIKGQGSATITATLPAGTEYRLNSSQSEPYVLEYPVSASYTVNVKDNSVITTKSTPTSPNLWQTFTFDRTYLTSTYPWYATETVMKLYLGGWKYQTGSELASRYNKTTDKYIGNQGETDDNGNDKRRVDSWSEPKIYEVGRETSKDYEAVPIDGYSLNSSSVENGKCEFLYTNRLLSGDYVLDFDTRKGERKPVDSADNTNGKGNPFTVPCFGAFIKIEPECNGQINLYVIQNGTIDFDANTNKLLNTINWRPVYIVDEAGNRLSASDVIATTKQKTTVSREDETVDVYEKNGSSIALVMDGDNVITYNKAIRAYKDSNTGVIYDLHKDVFEKYWNRRGDYEKVLGPDITGDGWVVITKAYVKYSFDVKAGKSYYVFSNKSAIGYCGATFLRDEDKPQVEDDDGNYSDPQTDLVVSSCNLYDSPNNTNMKDQLKDILGNNERVTIKSVTVNNTKKFHQGWNSICLPFSITESKMREIFGKKTTYDRWGREQSSTINEDYEVLLFNGCTESNIDADGNKTDKVHFFHHVYQDIIAGYPYMVYIPEGADRINQTYFTVNNVTIEKANLENLPTISTSMQYMPVGSGYEEHSPIGDFTFIGVYEPTNIPKDSYCVVNSGIKIYNAVTLPGYRAYLHPSYKNNGTSNYEVKRISATNLNELTYIWDEANPIKSIFVDGMSGNGFAAPSDVYSVSGVLVRKNSTSLEGLPKGVYIVNGKKYFVK